MKGVTIPLILTRTLGKSCWPASRAGLVVNIAKGAKGREPYVKDQVKTHRAAAEKRG
jgi:hypothetical protein